MAASFRRSGMGVSGRLLFRHGRGNVQVARSVEGEAAGVAPGARLGPWYGAGWIPRRSGLIPIFGIRALQPMSVSVFRAWPWQARAKLPAAVVTPPAAGACAGVSIGFAGAGFFDAKSRQGKFHRAIDRDACDRPCPYRPRRRSSIPGSRHCAHRFNFFARASARFCLVIIAVRRRLPRAPARKFRKRERAKRRRATLERNRRARLMFAM